MPNWLNKLLRRKIAVEPPPAVASTADPPIVEVTVADVVDAVLEAEIADLRSKTRVSDSHVFRDKYNTAADVLEKVRVKLRSELEGSDA